MLKYIFYENHDFFQDTYMNEIQMNIFCNIINVFVVSFIKLMHRCYIKSINQKTNHIAAKF